MLPETVIDAGNLGSTCCLVFKPQPNDPTNFERQMGNKLKSYESNKRNNSLQSVRFPNCY